MADCINNDDNNRLFFKHYTPPLVVKALYPTISGLTMLYKHLLTSTLDLIIDRINTITINRLRQQTIKAHRNVTLEKE